MDLPHPAVDLPHPGVDLPHPGVDLPRPGVDLPHPGVNLPHPGVDLPHPGVDLLHPEVVLPHLLGPIGIRCPFVLSVDLVRSGAFHSSVALLQVGEEQIPVTAALRFPLMA